MPMNFPRRRIPPLSPPKSTARQRILAQWRGVDMPTLEKLSLKGCKPIGKVIDSLVINLQLDKRLAETMILKVWNNLIDPNITAHACPTGLRNGTLFVTVDNTVRHYDIILYHRREILQRLQYSFGRELIARISFRVG
jgi:predicted nucleic acid-binding Zn ribbon protein